MHLVKMSMHTIRYSAGNHVATCPPYSIYMYTCLQTLVVMNAFSLIISHHTILCVHSGGLHRILHIPVHVLLLYMLYMYVLCVSVKWVSFFSFLILQAIVLYTCFPCVALLTVLVPSSQNMQYQVP